MRKMITLIATMAMILPLFVAPALADTNPATITSVFTIGSTTYTVNGVPQQMDVAPVIVNGRTLMPIRYLAYSLGIPESNIQYEQQWTFDPTDSAVIVKRDRASGYGLNVEVYYKPDGSNSGLLPRGEGGPIVKFDVPPEVLPPGRVMIPYRYVAQALGAIVSWNQAAQEVTVKTWQNLPAVPTGLTANQVSMQLGGNTVTATENGSQVGQWSYPYPVDVPNPYYADYSGPNKDPHLVAVIPALEAAGIPAQNILWDPDSQTLAVAGNNPDYFLYMTPGNGNAEVVNEFASNTTPTNDGQWVVLVQNGVLYGDTSVGDVLANSFNVKFNYSDNGQPISGYPINIIN